MTTAQILDFSLRPPIPVDNSPRFEMVYLLQIGKSPCRFYYLITTTQRLHGVFRENIGIEFHIDTSGSCSLDKQYRFAAAQYIQIHAFGKRVVVTDKLIVPTHAVGIERTDPNTSTLDTRSREIQIVRQINKSTILAQVLNRIPQRFHNGMVQIEFRIFHQNHSIGHSKQHTCYIIEHRLLPRTQSQRIERLRILALNQQTPLGPQHFISRENPFPQLLNSIQTSLGEVDMPPLWRFEFILEQIAALLAQQQEKQLVEFGRGILRYIVRILHKLLIHGFDRPRPNFVRRHNAQCLLSRKPKSMVLYPSSYFHSEPAFSGSIRANDRYRPRQQFFGLCAIVSFREQYFHSSTF